MSSQMKIFFLTSSQFLTSLNLQVAKQFNRKYMKKFKPLLLLVLLAGFISTSLFAQEPENRYDEKWYKAKDKEALEKFKDGDALFPPRPKSDMSIGIKGGLSFITGDISDYPIAPPGAIGISVRRAFGHAFSLRLEGNYTRNFGLDYRPRTGYISGIRPIGITDSINNNPWLQEGYTGPVFMNYRTKTFDLTLQGVFNLNNVNFYKENSKWNLYAAFGLGLMGVNTRVDVLDVNGENYDFTGIDFLPDNQLRSTFRDEKARVLNELQTRYGSFPSELDFESEAEIYSKSQGFNVGDDYYRLRALLTASAGIQYKISRRLEIEGEYRLGVTFDDMLDGLRWTEQGDLSPNWDNMNQMTIGLNFHLGNSREGGHWTVNPLSDMAYSSQQARKLVSDFQKDDDEDGVANFFDIEPDTPEGMPVDFRGKTKDTDGDGINDRDDMEMFTERGALVDEQGRAQDDDKDGIPDYRDKELGSEQGVQVDGNGITINNFTKKQIEDIVDDRMGPGRGCLMPIIYFELNKDDIKPTQYPQLWEIAQLMRSNPKLKVKAVGHTDVRNSDDYNDELSKRRVNNSVEFLVNTYGIDRSRFTIEFKGERENIIPELPDRRGNREIENLHQLNRRVVFECLK
jgi:outer membrane protein OmpA-like peptidoglycan-associated protein